MIGMVLVTHGRLADELRAAMEHVVGVQRNVDTVCIGPDDDIERRRADIQSCIGRCDTGDGVVLLTDMFGGTPSNLAISMMERKGVEVIAGVNLPMLVKLAKVRSNQPLADAVDCAQDAGRKYIATASRVLQDCRMKGGTLNGLQGSGGLNGSGTNGSGSHLKAGETPAADCCTANLAAGGILAITTDEPAAIGGTGRSS